MQPRMSDRSTMAVRPRSVLHTAQRITGVITRSTAPHSSFSCCNLHWNCCFPSPAAGKMARLSRGTQGPLCVLLVSLLIAAMHNTPTEAVMFDLAPQTRECFFVKSHNQESEVVGSYQTFFGDGSVRVTVEGPVPSHRAGAQLPQLTPVYSSVDESGRIQAPMALTGEYAVCVKNVLSFDQTITIDFHVQTHKEASHPNQLALEDEALRLKTLTADVLEKANSLFEQQSHAMVRLGVHSELGESTRRRATLWKCIQMGMQLLLAGIQIYSVKSYFEVKTIV